MRLQKESEKKKQVKIEKKKKMRKMREKNKRINSTIERKTIFYAKVSEIKIVMFLNQPMILLL